MKGSMLIVSFFVVGVILAFFRCIPSALLVTDYSQYALYCLMFLVGISIGSNKNLHASIRKQSWKIGLIPLGTIVGTLIGSAIISLFISGLGLFDCMAIGSGMGYYSLSSILISQVKGAEMGTIALVSNVSREIITLLSASLLVQFFGKLAPIAAGGATTMDTCLPVITKYSGKEYVLIAIFHGFTTDFCVPFLVSFFIRI